MRSLLISSFAFLALLSPMMTAAARAADEQPIKDRLQEFQSAWNKDDTTAMAAVWADDGSLINPVGVFAQGRDEIVKVFVQEHTSPGPFKATKYSTSDVKFQWVTPDVAVVDVSANISGIRGAGLHSPRGVGIREEGRQVDGRRRPPLPVRRQARAEEVERASLLVVPVVCRGA